MKPNRPALTIACAGLLSVSLLFCSGCRKAATITETELAAEDQSAQFGVVAEGPSKGGAQTWSENCMRCHNLRPPRERSDREWDIIVHHMRVRANLTAEEHRLILEFLQAAN